MTTLERVARPLFVLFLAACGGGSMDSEQQPASAPTNGTARRLAVTVGAGTSKLDQTLTGFFYPTGVVGASQECGTWLGRDRANGGCYFDGKYHNGVDFMTYSLEAKVYAIADGYIYKRHCDDDSWGPGNCALFVRHKTYEGKVFTAIYGHLAMSSTKASGEVYAGKPIGTTGRWSGGIHVHFGIFLGDVPPATIKQVRGWGMMANSQWPDTNSFVDPVDFIQTHSPHDPSLEVQARCVGNLCWSPPTSSCENASQRYRLGNNMLAQPAGSDVCWEAQEKLFSIGDGPDSQDRVPNDPPWQHWWRALLDFFGETASAADIRDFGTVNTITILTGQVVAGSASKLVHGTGLGYATEGVLTQPALLPDFIGRRSWFETPWGFEIYQYGRAETLKMKGRFENIGDGPCVLGEKDSITARAYLSKGYKPDSSTTRKSVGTDEIKCSNLKPGDTHTETEGLVLADLELGIHNVIWCIDHPQTDHNEGGDHVEKREGNNCTRPAVFEVVEGTVNVPTIDFSISGFTVLQAPIYAGDWARFGGYVRNDGTASPSVGIRSSYIISCNGGPAVWLTDDATEASELGPGQSKWEETIAAVRMPDTPGTCIVTMTANYQGVVGETDVGNNSESLTLTLLPRPLPDLIITYIEMESWADRSIQVGKVHYPTMKIKNVGPGPVTTTIRSAYYWYGPSTGNVWQQIADDGTEAAELPPGAEVTETIKAGFKATKKGTHYLKACANYQGSQPETDTTNNCLTTGPITVK